MTDRSIDWRATVDEAIRRRKEEGLSQRSLAALAGVSLPTVNAFEQGQINLRFERVIAILEALDLFLRPADKDSLESFLHDSRRRWEDLIAPLPPDHPSRQPLGHSEQSYAILGLKDVPPPSQLRELLTEIPKSSGWTPFWVSTRTDLRPVIEDGALECWLGRPDTDRHFRDAAHSDFWRVTRDPFAYLQRGYQEDGPDNLEPGTIFDLTLPVWRTAEFFLHAVNFARALGAIDTTEIRFVARYTGLEGRTLITWTKPLLHERLDHRLRARSYKADLATVAQVSDLERNLEDVVHDFVEPLYERFDGYRPSIELVANQLSELRRQSGFGARGG
ncbi:helix-turn-helix domain-containing protein [Novosphingobium mathurense]|uniref:Helix-turn-helix n=1 Tax=Novosphingobium mathurense TaxID=428990 RepID=A0A1U6IU50_9SPHN|nr:helix-turn-helix domain-containing protein [Novosphingobium mathurense]SLK11550.1 Helix-turn-helix [Novosphingobium mathurense]